MPLYLGAALAPSKGAAKSMTWSDTYHIGIQPHIVIQLKVYLIC